jgi:hypothetical protein
MDVSKLRLLKSPKTTGTVFNQLSVSIGKAHDKKDSYQGSLGDDLKIADS